MGPAGPDPNTVMEFYQEALLWSMWLFLGMAVMASAAYGIFLLQQWLLPQDGKRAIKTLECGGDYEEPEIP